MTTCQLCERDLPSGEVGRAACTTCQARLYRHLGEIPHLYRQLAAMLQPGSGRAGPAVSGTKTAGLPVNEDALSLRAWGGIVTDLATHEDDWRRQLQLPRARFRGTAEQTLDGIVAWLSGHLWWACERYPHVDGLAEDVRRIRADARTVVDPPEHTVRAGNCPAVFEDGAICGAVLRVPPGASEIDCRWCGAVYPPTMWLALARDLWVGDEVEGRRVAS